LNELKSIEETAQRILQENPAAAVRFRLLRDVLKLSPPNGELISAKQEMLQSRWVLELKKEQKEDGSWGRFHSTMKTKGKILTTEAAVERGLALGLEASDPIFQAAINYLSRLLDGSLELLSCFPSWRKFARNIIDWLWTQRNNEGLWDFGPRANTSVYFPLSESWRENEAPTA